MLVRGAKYGRKKMPKNYYKRWQHFFFLIPCHGKAETIQIEAVYEAMGFILYKNTINFFILWNLKQKE
jgi:hypothetical protein